MSDPSQAPTAGPVPPIDLEEDESEESEKEEEPELIPRQKGKGKARIEKDRKEDTIIRNIILENTVSLT